MEAGAITTVKSAHLSPLAIATTKSSPSLHLLPLLFFLYVQHFATVDSPEVLPSLIKFIATNEVAGFYNGQEPKKLDTRHQQTGPCELTP
ncbi:hypothetical protein Vadar_017851 [Vaccinium darrowii]|uniref:Uncharacterized protein n=1 Tax=Vaccinium darrowii TaxID=229202 RepID=A0ACB7X248_9ERIC|nr:hypothetical protein Vadar_017851 [Vaccinium darrowii]